MVFLFIFGYLLYMNLTEELHRIKQIMSIDEMAYPVEFDFEEFMQIKSYTGRIKYAQQRLLDKVGAGSGRAVFRIDDEKVMKIALDQVGVAQNEAEGEEYKQNYDVLARVFDVDHEYTWIEMELAKRISPSRFKQLVGVDLDTLMLWLSSTLVRYDKNAPDLGENEFAGNLQSFAGDYQYRVPGDFQKINSYGEVLRDGQPTVVLVDFGFSRASEKLYTAKREAKVKRRDMRRNYRY
jgi:hypothetical protein